MELRSHSANEIINTALEASAWCDLRWSDKAPRASLRTLEFSPEFFGTDHYYTVNDIVCARRYEMERLNLEPHKNLNGGKILVYEPDSNVSDGLSEFETNGFLDAHDCPPWDTWIGYINDGNMRYVLSWIPCELVASINSGAEVNCVDCFYWLNDSNFEWAKQLSNAIISRPL